MSQSRVQQFVSGARRRGVAGLAVAGLVAGTAASAGWHATRVVADEVGPPPAAAARTIGDSVDSYAALVDEVSPAVVTVRAERRARTTQQSPFEGNPMFERFFRDRGGVPQVPSRPQAALGSGVVVRSDGYVLTNHHVIDGAENITLEFTDRRTLDATLVGSDAPSDLAVLKVDATSLKALTLGDSDAVRVGDVVLALGNPLGVGQTVTMGIISAKSRSTGLGDGSFEDFLQTDAPINSGNSGGALVDTRGALIGINSQILSPSGGNIGIGFAIPASMARGVMDQLIESGEVRRAQLGVSAQTITSDIASSLGLKDVRGALVGDVVAGSAGAKAGIRRGDVILAVNGQPIADSNALRNRIAASAPGSTVSLTVVRDGREQTLSATLGALEGRRAAGGPAARSESRGRFGLQVEPLTPESARELGVSAEQGVVVAGVDASGPAARAGVRQGDVIEQVDGKAVGSVDQLQAALGDASDRPVLMLLHRGDQSLFVTMRRG